MCIWAHSRWVECLKPCRNHLDPSPQGRKLVKACKNSKGRKNCATTGISEEPFELLTGPCPRCHQPEWYREHYPHLKDDDLCHTRMPPPPQTPTPAPQIVRGVSPEVDNLLHYGMHGHMSHPSHSSPHASSSSSSAAPQGNSQPYRMQSSINSESQQPYQRSGGGSAQMGGGNSGYMGEQSYQAGSSAYSPTPYSSEGYCDSSQGYSDQNAYTPPGSSTYNPPSYSSQGYHDSSQGYSDQNTHAQDHYEGYRGGTINPAQLQLHQDEAPRDASEEYEEHQPEASSSKDKGKKPSKGAHNKGKDSRSSGGGSGSGSAGRKSGHHQKSK